MQKQTFLAVIHQHRNNVTKMCRPGRRCFCKFIVEVGSFLLTSITLPFFLEHSPTKSLACQSLLPVVTDKSQPSRQAWYLTLRVLPPQVGGCADRVHEEQGVGQVLPRAPGISQALVASGLLSAQAGAEDPQVPPTAARASVSPERQFSPFSQA